MPKALLYLSDADHHARHATWISEGFKRCGWQVARPRHDFDLDGDLVVSWGWRLTALFAKAMSEGVPVLLLERGHLHPRTEWTSMGFNGLGGYGVYADCLDDGQRFARHYGHQMRPWREDGDYVLVMGQMQGDASLHGANIREWAAETCRAYREAGHRVVYRPHPNANQNDHPECVEVHKWFPLEDSLRRASLCVTYTSTSGVEAVLAGIPTVTCNRGAMAWPVAAHGILKDPVRPDRTAWANKLAWTQFSAEEISSGFAWSCLKDFMPRPK